MLSLLMQRGRIITESSRACLVPYYRPKTSDKFRKSTPTSASLLEAIIQLRWRALYTETSRGSTAPAYRYCRVLHVPRAHGDAGALQVSHTLVFPALPHAAAARATVSASRTLHTVIVLCTCIMRLSLCLGGHRWPDGENLVRRSRARTCSLTPSAHRCEASYLHMAFR